MKKLTAILNNAIMDDNGNYYARATLTGLKDEPKLAHFEGKEVVVVWLTINPDDTDESNACEWENPDGIVFYGVWLFDGKIGINCFEGYEVDYINP
jgi:hypothetical protein